MTKDFVLGETQLVAKINGSWLFGQYKGSGAVEHSRTSTNPQVNCPSHLHDLRVGKPAAGRLAEQWRQAEQQLVQLFIIRDDVFTAAHSRWSASRLYGRLDCAVEVSTPE